MHSQKINDEVGAILDRMAETHLGPLDLLPHNDLPEKVIDLILSGVPAGFGQATADLTELTQAISEVDTRDLNVVVFGGGTGLSNIIGGDSRSPDWPQKPFYGLKKIFPKTQSIICVTDDGGSTGELLKDLPIIALGDLRHVLLSSVQEQKLQQQYGLTEKDSLQTASILHSLFNYRFSQRPDSLENLLLQAKIDIQGLPDTMGKTLYSLLKSLFSDDRLENQMSRPHCLGNLLLACAIYKQFDKSAEFEDSIVPPEAVTEGMRFLADLMGAHSNSVLPCTTTPAHLKMLYGNGVLVSGEYKSAHARRGCPVDRVFVEFARKPYVSPDILEAIDNADIILFAPGSLYTSIIPILQVPGIAEAVRRQQKAVKILVANLWVQKGETDLVSDDPKRRFYVSDLIKAYHRNIPGGVEQLFQQILTLGLQEIPGSILQNYALEDKMPIYLDRDQVRQMGFAPVEAKIYSQNDIAKRRVVQHDSFSLSYAVQTIWAIRGKLTQKKAKNLPPCQSNHKKVLVNPKQETPNQRFAAISNRLNALAVEQTDKGALLKIFWNHWDIPLAHLDYFKGVRLVEHQEWGRCQEWDNIFSFYDPEDSFIKIRQDIFENYHRFEFAFLVALGQSLLGNYAAEKQNVPIEKDGEVIGKAFKLALRSSDERQCFFNETELDQYLRLVRMNRSSLDDLVYTRLVNGNEGFTPPGLLFGLTYAWYLDNRFASNIENKMSIINMEISDLIPEQVNVYKRRNALVDFFRTVVFRYDFPV